MIKKFLALFIALLTVAFAITACNDSKDDPAQTTAATTLETTAATTTAPEPYKTIKLSDVTIFHTSDDYSRTTATYLQEIIKNKTGADVAISDKYEPSESYKILIGNFKLDATNDFFKKSSNHMEKYYQVVFQDNLVIIAAGSRIPAEAACDSLIEKTMSNRIKTMKISNDFSFVGDYYGHAEIGFNSRIDEGDIRIVTFNIANYIDPMKRTGTFFKLIELFEADILMFQEALALGDLSSSPLTFYNWHDVIDSRLSSKYGYIEVPTNDSKITHNKNRNPIYYAKDKLELISSEYHECTYAHEGAYPTSFSVAEFKVKSTSKTFSCICSHFSTTPNTRIVNEKEIAEFITNYQSEHNNAPLFLLGDLNAKRDQLSSQLKKVMTHALDMPGIVKKNTDYGTSCAVTGVWPGNWLQKDGLLIDHALGTGNGYKGKQFMVVATPMAAATSDHIPVVFDFELN